MGITHHSNYIRWFEEARIDFLREMGWGYDKLEEMGIMIPVTLVECKYKKSTTFADEVEIIVEIEKFQGVRLCLNYQIKNNKEEVVCTGRSEHCFLNPQGKEPVACHPGKTGACVSLQRHAAPASRFLIPHPLAATGAARAAAPCCNKSNALSISDYVPAG